ncbi:glycosyltransferase [Bradyrhizobium sp. SHOUNA76]|uniref:glycosyltransferase n=1 Tax=Bradyrhizobium sp. SHOUNA76 TaxID=2908927 RepID=UPI001FF28BF7|nr:glycosyltransferase [Bradyrhizobium sp. SHOUNA76]MCJ9701411.1 glycosyltransferase [Bradyrhizobium sp. SHOUNA76]
MGTRVLWLAKAFPYEDSFGGDLVYSKGLMEGLIANNVALTVICFAEVSSETRTTTHGIRWIKIPLQHRSRILSIFSVLPSISHRYASERYNEVLRETLKSERWSAIVLDSIAMGVLLPSLTQTKAQKIYLAHNDETIVRRQFARTARSKLRKIPLLWDAKKAELLEKDICNRVDCIATITEQDSTTFRERHPLVETVVCAPGYSDIPQSLPDFKGTRTRTIVLLGSLHWAVKQQNLESFLEYAYERFLGKSVSIRIVGDTPPQFAKRMLERFPQIDFRGKVKFFEEHLADCRVGLVIDELGGGFKLKILDYIFNGIPVAGLIHAMEGSHLRPGTDYIGSDTTEELVSNILRSMDDIDQLTSLRNSAYAHSKTRYSWRGSAETLLQAIHITEMNVKANAR